MDVVGLSALAGASCAAPIAFLSLMTVPAWESLRQGAALNAALASSLPTFEDWEHMPYFLFASVVVGAVAAPIASLAWLFVDAQAPRKPWLGHGLAAGLMATLAAMFYLVNGLWASAAVSGILAGLIVLVLAPRLGYQRRRPVGPSLTRTARLG